MLDFLIVLAVVAAVAVFVTTPLRRPRHLQTSSDGATGSRSEGVSAEPSAERDELEAAREAKYREIREAELDRHTGKLSEADFEAVDGELRAEAMEILRALDRAREA
jgi:hypothetical protein